MSADDTPATEDCAVVILDDDPEPATTPFIVSNHHCPSTPPRPATIPITPTNSTTSVQVTDVSSVRGPQDKYPWSRDVRKALTRNFKLTDFRKNQLEAINTTIKGDDVFVLMPTGGGKSLCYQLPAIIQGRERRGVTIVVSPLLSLMQDQVDQLVNGRGIAAALMNGQLSASDRKWVFGELQKDPPGMQLLYITPEMIQRSTAFDNILRQLHRRNNIARFVIDEAHCVSQWGHDFRPDYKLLGGLKLKFSDVPIMALTATANERVQQDVIHNLHIVGCKVLKQSFNRSNLMQTQNRYDVVKKTPKTMLDDISQFIRQHPGQSGIIYCISRRQCEDVAQKLSSNYRISCYHYHAALESEERIRIQKQWQRGEIKVIVATIAFGMGIDKPDVRFVIHYSLPSSVEGYYQETGRAGRDGLPASCRLYYSFVDTRTHQMLIQNGDGDLQQKQRLQENLNQMIRYCENKADCRRKQVLSYFGENFDPRLCKRTCDNCRNNEHLHTYEKDMTGDAKCALQLIGELTGEKVTLAQLVDILRGSRGKRIVDSGFTSLGNFGSLKHLNRTDADRLLKQLVFEKAMVERSETNAMGFTTSYIFPGPKYGDVLTGRLTISLSFTSVRLFLFVCYGRTTMPD
ncbi:P-loop containing nucleoside triphosphate hydrolase protein [Dichotomocladium elegans]|nr:P-loop containing nucleoside triphosphate hydrolase protein [Dichotomocladium elegans]